MRGVLMNVMQVDKCLDRFYISVSWRLNPSHACFFYVLMIWVGGSSASNLCRKFGWHGDGSCRVVFRRAECGRHSRLRPVTRSAMPTACLIPLRVYVQPSHYLPSVFHDVLSPRSGKSRIAMIGKVRAQFVLCLRDTTQIICYYSRVHAT